MSSFTLYHGSDHVIEAPVFGGGREHNDYGRGFYCTEHLEMAKEWAVSGKRDGCTNCYAFCDDGLSVLNLNGDGYTILHWLAVLLQNRVFDLPAALPLEARDYIVGRFRVPLEEADVIRGYRADDAYFSFAQDFLNGLISLRQLSRAMRLGKLGEQVAVMSEAAFGRLDFRGAEFVSKDEWYPRYKARDSRARRDYFDVERFRREPDDLYVLQILNEEVGPNDPRLR